MLQCFRIIIELQISYKMVAIKSYWLIENNILDRNIAGQEVKYEIYWYQTIFKET